MTRDAGVELRLITGEQIELEALQHVLEAVPHYARIVSGAPFGPDEALQTYTELPEGKTRIDKFVFGIHHNNEMIGCVDLVRGYPVPSTAMLGLLAIIEDLQGQGLGTEIQQRIEEVVCSWDTCERIRIGVVAANDLAFLFWHSVGFVPTGERKTYTHGTFVSEVVVLEKSLCSARVDA